jgi:hypothetical protein
MRTVLIAAALSLPLVAAATAPTLAAGNYGSSATGGGSAGYNHGVATDYRLKKHHPVTGKKLHNQMKPKKTSAKAAKPKS